MLQLLRSTTRARVAFTQRVLAIVVLLMGWEGHHGVFLLLAVIDDGI